MCNKKRAWKNQFIMFKYKFNTNIYVLFWLLIIKMSGQCKC